MIPRIYVMLIDKNRPSGTSKLFAANKYDKDNTLGLGGAKVR